jgi:predicted  nucleic acid-binding Zn-ribbon protein
MWRALIITAALATPALAQKPPDMATLQRAIGVLQQQRNQAMDALANAEVQRSALADQVEKLKAEIEELKKRAAVERPQKD